MAEHNVKILGFGDNVVDMYEHLKTMYPGGNCVNLCAYAKQSVSVSRNLHTWDILEMMTMQNM